MLKASYADMAKLADALASGANRGNPVQVQVLLSAFFIGRHLIRCLLFCAVFIHKKQSNPTSPAIFYCKHTETTL